MWTRALIVLVVLLASRLPRVAAAPPEKGPEKAADGRALKFFEERVRPVLAENCFKCHGPKKQKGGLRLDSRDAAFRGGDSGPVILPGHPDDSLLIKAIRQTEHPKMPPDKKLPDPVIADLTRWVMIGAPWPTAPATVRPPSDPSSPAFTAQDRTFWAFQKPVAAPLPAVNELAWVRSPIDAFILARLEAKGLKPARTADRRTLIRRATFDLIGLPPTPAEVEAFLQDDSPDAFAKVIDRLLASPHYGERWGRHWLDVARYADSNGMDENLTQANAWRYRDYVINAFNQDKPYDRFVREQLAGDLLPAPDEATGIEQVVATGYLALGPKMLAEDDPVKMQMDIVDEQIDTMGRAFLGLTLGCARCHDHKFDPIPTADYYSLAGVFKSTQTMDNFSVVARWHERTVATRTEIARKEAHDRLLAQNQNEIDRRVREGSEHLVRRARQWAADPKGPFALPADIEANYPPALVAELKRLREQRAALEKARPVLPEAMAVTEGPIANVCIHIRGSHWTQGSEVPRQFPRILAGDKQLPIGAKQSGRLQLAEWLTRPDHPLTARVMVNRVWLGHFGQGLVRSPDNFGRLGERPDNQPLLDWLAVRFVAAGWSVKAMHRLIMLSNTYQMSTVYDEKAALADPENRLLWRMNRRRLEAEAIRDALLAASGRLDRTMGGSLLQGNNRAYVLGYPNSSYNGYDADRRSVYLPVIRSDVYQVFQAFDFADPSVPNGQREVTTVAPQALFMMNAKLLLEQTRHMATLLLAQPSSDADRVRLAYERALGRPPAEQETARMLAFLQRVETIPEIRKLEVGERRLRAWQSVCRVLLASNEFLYVE
jgi:hypothetical protein